MAPHLTSSTATNKVLSFRRWNLSYFFNMLTAVVLVWHCAPDYRRSLNQVVQSARGPWGRECATSCQTAQRNNQSSERLQDRGERERGQGDRRDGGTGERENMMRERERETVPLQRLT